MKTNIVLIMTDQQRWDSLGCYGNEIVETPNIDKLAKESVVFESAYSSCPACVPARGCLLTGLNQYNLGSLSYGAALKSDYPVTLPKLLKEEGYTAVAVGKNHFTPQRAKHGYDEVILDESARVESDDFVSDYMAWFKDETGHERIIPEYMDFNGFRGSPYEYEEYLHPTSWVKETAKRQLEKLCTGENPWFLKISFARPHSPYDPPERWFDYYINKNLPMPVESDWGEKFKSVKGGEVRWQGSAAYDENRKTRAGYYGSVSFIDEAVGEIIDFMKERGIFDNSLIIYTSDHGDMLGDHNLWRKTYAYEGSVHIPMLIKPPKGTDICPGANRTPCSLYDILPTVMGFLNENRNFNSDGIDLFRQTRKYIHGEYISGYVKKMDMQFVCDGDYKLIWYLRTGDMQFFDLKKDPYERNNLFGTNEYSKKIEEFVGFFIKEMSGRGIKIRRKRNGKLTRYPFRLPYGIYGIDGKKS